MAWGMTGTITTDEDGRTLAEHSLWGKFMLATVLLDGENHPRGYHWLLSLKRLVGTDVTTTLFKLPDEHPLKLVVIPEWIDKPDLNKRPPVRDEHPLKDEIELLKKDLKKNKKIDFSGLTFGEESKEKIYFSNFIFPIDVNFNNTTFSKDVYFTNAVFSDTASFKNAKFHGETANFRDATFKKEADFEKATFKEYANFKGAKFSDRTIFQLVKFELHAPRFYGAKFNNELILNRIKLPKTNKFIHNQNYKVYQKTIDENQDKDICQIYKIIKEKRKTNHENYQKIIEENKSAYETLIYLMEEQNKHHDKHRFFREEMRWRQLGNKLTRERRITDSGWRTGELYFIWWCIRNYFTKKRITNDSRKNAEEYYSYWQQLENTLNIIIFGLYGVLSDYGYGMGRALAWWFVHICAWAGILYFFVFQDKCETYQRLSCSFFTSLSNAHSFFLSKSERLTSCAEIIKDKSLFDFIWAMETISGALFLFLILLTLRVRFRIK